MSDPQKESRTEYADRMAEYLRRFETDIRDLQEKAHKAGADVQADYKRNMAELERQRDHALVELKHMQATSALAWDDMQKGFEQARDAMKEAWKKASSRI